jgi:hypothetical protein
MPDLEPASSLHSDNFKSRASKHRSANHKPKPKATRSAETKRKQREKKSPAGTSLPPASAKVPSLKSEPSFFVFFFNVKNCSVFYLF